MNKMLLYQAVEFSDLMLESVEIDSLLETASSGYYRNCSFWQSVLASIFHP